MAVFDLTHCLSAAVRQIEPAQRSRGVVRFQRVKDLEEQSDRSAAQASVVSREQVRAHARYEKMAFNTRALQCYFFLAK